MSVFPSRLQIQSANAISRGFTIDAVRARRSETQEAINDAARALDKLRECGADRDYLQDTLAGLLDVAFNIDGECERDLDGADTWAPEKLDVSEVQAVLGKVLR